MSKLLALGLPLVTVVECAPAAPADVLGRHELGRLQPGAVADVAAFELREEPVRFRDVTGREFEGTRLLVPRWTMKDGQLFDRKGTT
jgi:dihydroorotase